MAMGGLSEGGVRDVRYAAVFSCELRSWGDGWTEETPNAGRRANGVRIHYGNHTIRRQPEAVGERTFAIGVCLRRRPSAYCRRRSRLSA